MFKKFDYRGEAHCLISGRVIDSAADAIAFNAADVSGYSSNADADSYVFVLTEEFNRVHSDALPYVGHVYGGRTFALEVHIDMNAVKNPDIMRLEFLKQSRSGVNPWVRLRNDRDGFEVYAINLANLKRHGVLDVIERHAPHAYIMGDVFQDGAYIGTAVARWATRNEAGHWLKKSERSGRIPFLMELDGITTPFKGWANY